MYLDFKAKALYAYNSSWFFTFPVHEFLYITFDNEPDFMTDTDVIKMYMFHLEICYGSHILYTIIMK